MKKIKIGEYRILPADEKVWAIALQEVITFDREQIIEITNTIFGTEVYVFGKIKFLTGNIPGLIPTLVDKHNGDLGSINYDKTLPYKLPKPISFDYLNNFIHDGH